MTDIHRASPFPLTISAKPPRSFWYGVKNQIVVIHAMLLRDLHSRYGRHNIGYLWMIGEPLMLSTAIALLHLAQPSHFTSDIQPIPFAIIGYTTYIIFRGIFSKAEGIIDSNVPVFYHRQVSVLDIVTARAAIEACGCVVSMITLMGLAIMLNYANLPYRPLYLFGAVALMIWWSFALALIAARVSYQNETVGRQLHVLSYFALPISGSFVQLSTMPSWISNITQWFPMTLIFEQARFGQFQYASSHYVSIGYVCFMNACLTYIGLVLTRRLRRNL